MLDGFCCPCVASEAGSPMDEGEAGRTGAWLDDTGRSGGTVLLSGNPRLGIAIVAATACFDSVSRWVSWPGNSEGCDTGSSDGIPAAAAMRSLGGESDVDGCDAGAGVAVVGERTGTVVGAGSEAGVAAGAEAAGGGEGGVAAGFGIALGVAVGAGGVGAGDDAVAAGAAVDSGAADGAAAGVAAADGAGVSFLRSSRSGRLAGDSVGAGVSLRDALAERGSCSVIGSREGADDAASRVSVPRSSSSKSRARLAWSGLAVAAESLRRRRPPRRPRRRVRGVSASVVSPDAA